MLEPAEALFQSPFGDEGDLDVAVCLCRTRAASLDVLISKALGQRQLCLLQLHQLQPSRQLFGLNKALAHGRIALKKINGSSVS